MPTDFGSRTERTGRPLKFWTHNCVFRIFTDDELNDIWNTTLKTIIVETTAISSQSLQNNVFLHNAGDPCPQPYQVNTSNLEACTPFMRFDHFTGNEVGSLYCFKML
jgi:dual oxidase